MILSTYYQREIEHLRKPYSEEESLTGIVNQYCNIHKVMLQKKLADLEEIERACKKAREKLEEHIKTHGIPEDSEIESKVNKYSPIGLNGREEYQFNKITRPLIKARLREDKKDIRRISLSHYHLKRREEYFYRSK